MSGLNGDASGERAQKQAAAIRRDALAVQIAAYSGDRNGLLDLQMAECAAAELYRSLSYVST